MGDYDDLQCIVREGVSMAWQATKPMKLFVVSPLVASTEVLLDRSISVNRKSWECVSLSRRRRSVLRIAEHAAFNVSRF